MRYCNQIVTNLERKIQTINSGTSNVFEEIELGVLYSKKTLKKLRIRISAEGFLSPTDECLFFKSIKPKPLGYLIYYLTLAEFETRRPKNTLKKIKKYIQDNITTYQNYCCEHKSFYQYLERKRTDKDNQYFLRSYGLVTFHPDGLSFCVDEGFSTSHDFIVAKIFAHKLLIERLNTELDALEKSGQLPKSQILNQYQLQWTRNKVDLIELIYALHETGAINNGNIRINELANNFAQFLNIDVGEFYRTYLQIRSRKINQTKFLDQMVTHLKKRMYQADE